MSSKSEAYESAVFDAGLEKQQRCYLGVTRAVYRGGKGPAVIVLSELPGITPPTLSLCGRLMGAGYRVVVPQLFGTPGRPMTAACMLSAFARLCVSREFELLALERRSPITDWLNALARAEQLDDSQVGVGVIGMCTTGGFALAMLLEPAVVAPVLSQPSLPLSWTSDQRCALGLSDPELQTVRRRVEQENLTVLGLRFSADKLAPKQRFERLRKELGERFVAIELPSEPGNAHGIRARAHSVLTNDYVDEPAHPTSAAFQEVLSLFERQLRPRAHAAQ